MAQDLKVAIDDLLEESIAACTSRESVAFQQSVEGTSGVVVFGAGGLGRKVVGILREQGVEPVAFADNTLAGQVISGTPVLSPDEAASLYGASCAFVVAIWASWNDTGAQLRSLRQKGCRVVIPFNFVLWSRADQLPHVQVELPSRLLEQRAGILECFDLWSDERSRQEFIAQLRWRLHADYDALTPPVLPAYWQTSLVSLGADPVYVDGGAFDGDTVEQFIELTGGSFRRIYAFEPDPANFEQLARRVETMPIHHREKIVCIPSGIAEASRTIPFQTGLGAGSAFGGPESVRCEALDDVLPLAPTFIKLDIEGFELQGLAGAARILCEKAPALAICAYHRADDLWRIPLLIHSTNPEYRLYLRPHGEVWETVCYGVVPKTGINLGS